MRLIALNFWAGHWGGGGGGRRVPSENKQANADFDFLCSLVDLGVARVLEGVS